MPNLTTGVPLSNVPFVDREGKVSEAWFIFLVMLWRRTGGGPGPSEPITVNTILSLEQTFAPYSVAAANDDSVFDMIMPITTGVAQEIALDNIVFPPSQTWVVNQTFSSGSDFTGGVTTVLTLNESFRSSDQLWIFFDAAFQGDDQYSLSGISITFTSAIPVGTNKIYVKGIR